MGKCVSLGWISHLELCYFFFRTIIEITCSLTENQSNTSRDSSGAGDWMIHHPFPRRRAVPEPLHLVIWQAAAHIPVRQFIKPYGVTFLLHEVMWRYQTLFIPHITNLKPKYICNKITYAFFSEKLKQSWPGIYKGKLFSCFNAWIAGSWTCLVFVNQGAEETVLCSCATWAFSYIVRKLHNLKEKLWTGCSSQSFSCKGEFQPHAETLPK